MENLSRNEIIDILKDDSQNDWLFSLADKTRHKYVGDAVHLRGLSFQIFVKGLVNTAVCAVRIRI